MIRIESVTVEEFRGIRSLTLDMKGKNYAIYGPNGTGKSGIVDAIEFALTGNISRLSGAGTEGITIKQHSPHVDSRNAPEKACVTVSVFIPKLKTKASIRRTVKSPNSPVITPSDPGIVAVFKELEKHPECVLTRRELIRYVIAPAGERAKEVQALLRLDRVEEARALFEKVANACEKEKDRAIEARDASRVQLAKVLGIGTLTPAGLLEAANAKRAILGLDPLKELTAQTSLREGLDGAASKSAPQRVPKAQAAAEIRDLKTRFDEHRGDQLNKEREAVEAKLAELRAAEASLGGQTKEGFLRTGLDLIAEGMCPFCDTAWEIDKLKTQVQAQLARFSEVALLRNAAQASMSPLASHLDALAGGIDRTLRYAALFAPPPDVAPLKEMHSLALTAANQLKALRSPGECLQTVKSFVPMTEAAAKAIGTLEEIVAKLPEPTQSDAARDYLTASQERLEIYRDNSNKLKKAEEQAALSRKAADLYVQVSTDVLKGIYLLVEKDFSDFYGTINHEDESKFSAKLVPSLGKLGFDVDFYGRGYFPPGAYHSEGHQDSMGLCLYLALMGHLLKEDFTFAVLDDVLMSVDAGHRREVCALFKKRFPNTQFILTTHDRVWLQHMQAEALVSRNNSMRFRTWSVDQGPTEWDDKDVWGEIDLHLGRNDTRSAAGLLRHYLEYVGSELCHRLRAPVEYKADGQMQLGEVLPPAISRLQGIYSAGKNAANSWNQKDKVKELIALSDRLTEATKASKADQWQLNAAVHYNVWENLSKEELAATNQAFRNLVQAFQCSSCEQFLYVLPERGGEQQTLRCDCNALSVNLVQKSG